MDTLKLLVICSICVIAVNAFATRGPIQQTPSPDSVEQHLDNDNDRCQLPADAGPCYASFPRWYWSDRARMCKEFTYGGCDGNDNNFETKEDCLSACGNSQNGYPQGGHQGGYPQSGHQGGHQSGHQTGHQTGHHQGGHHQGSHGGHGGHGGHQGGGSEACHDKASVADCQNRLDRCSDDAMKHWCPKTCGFC